MNIKSSICGIQHTCINFLIFLIITKIECWPVFKQDPFFFMFQSVIFESVISSAMLKYNAIQIVLHQSIIIMQFKIIFSFNAVKEITCLIWLLGNRGVISCRNFVTPNS